MSLLRPFTTWMAALLVSAAACVYAPLAQANATSGDAAAVQTQAYRLQDLGVRHALTLRGVDGMNSFALHRPANEQWLGARLKLKYLQSPDLIDGLSHLKVSIDGQHAATVALRAKRAGAEQTQTIELPAHLLKDYSQLNFQLIGHYTLRCEDPRHPSLWLTIGNDSELELDVRPQAHDNDLAQLPGPFFDARQAVPLTLPVVLAGAADADSLQAAGAVASWFGALADYRGARFPVSLNALPSQGHAVVLWNTANAATIAGLSAAPDAGPVIRLVDHPADPSGRLLVIQGGNAAELLEAARALTTSAATLSGASARIDQVQNLLPRKPYDAPRWLPTDRPVNLGEFFDPAAMGAKGFSADYIRLGIGVPPDLYAWRDQTAWLNLQYRYMPRAESGVSALGIQINDSFLASLPIPSEPPQESAWAWSSARAAADGMPAQARLPIPVKQLAAQSQLEFHFVYDFISQGECRDTLYDFMQARIDPASTIDLSALHHFIEMPNMAAFSNGGFPFTRLADLSETAVVLPAQPSSADLEAYLTLLGHFGAITGYPATHVTVSTPAQLDSLSDKDILVLSSGAPQQSLGAWQRYLPLQPGQTYPAIRDPQQDSGMPWQRWFGNAAESADGVAAPSALNVLVTGFESPLSRGRSVVVLAATQSADLAQAAHALTDADLLKTISGSSMVIRDDRIDVVAHQSTYEVGQLGLFRYTQWVLERHIVLASLFSLFVILIAGILLYLSFRARAQRRLPRKHRNE